MSKRYHRAILVSCEIPWNDVEELLEDVFRQEVRATLENFNNLYIFGTAGEGHAVTLTQFRDIAQIFWDETNRAGVHTMVGCIGMSTAQVVERVAVAHDIGFRMFQIVLPPWGVLSDREYITYFEDVCGSFPDSEFLHYNLRRAGRILQATDYMRIEQVAPNLVATKTTRSDPSETASLVTKTELQHFLGEANFTFGCLYGECSLLSSTAPMFPSRTRQFFQYGLNGQFEQLFRLEVEMSKAMEAFFAPATQVDTERIDGAWDKMIVRAGGINMPLRLLSPYHGFDLETFEACLASLKERYPDWLE